MRKWLFLAIIGILLLSPAALAKPLNNWKIDIIINDDRTTDWTVTLTYNELVNKSDYFVFSPVTNLQVFADDKQVYCDAQIKVGTLIVCNNLSSAKTVQYKFTANNQVVQINQLNRFVYKFSLIQLTEKFSVNIKIPLGAALVEKSKLEGTGMSRFEPSWGREGSDGRVIYMEWIATDPKLGDTYDISLIYEKIVLPGTDMPYMIILAVAVIIISIVAAVLYLRRKSPKHILPVLTEGERKTVEILLRDKEVDQRKIVKETDFSKAKVSRIIHDLEARGVVEKRPKGRTNIIKLKKIEKNPKNESHEKKS